MNLSYLDFDYSEDYEGTGTFDAMASVPPQQWDALQNEIARVLGWCTQQFPEGPAPAEEGGDWHYDLQGVEEISTPMTVSFHPATGRIERHSGPAGAPRTTLTLSISGNPQFCEEFRTAFGV